MKIEVKVTGGVASGKTHILTRIKQLLEDKDFSVDFPGEICDVPHEHALVATRPDDWLTKELVRKRE